MKISANECQWIELLPKVELHLHLEGAIPYDALWELIQKYGGDPALPDLDSLRQKLTYRDFSHFIDTWVWKNSFLREYDDFTFIAEAVARDLVKQNIRYAEVFYSPRDFARHGLESQKLTEAIRSGLSQVDDIEVKLVVDLIRDFGPQKGRETLLEINEVRDLGVIGVGIGGSEQLYPPEVFAPVYESARELGFRTNAHAGEAAGPQSVWGAIQVLRVDRIGHGTRAVEDTQLVEHLAATQIPVELNPLSNVATGVVASLAEHPTKNYLDRGVLVCVNTDDPRMFHNSLVDEFVGLREHLGISITDVQTLILNGVRASWLDDERKAQMLEEFQSHPAWNSCSQ